MKLHRLLQKCSFFLIKPAVFLAGGSACMRLRKAEVSFSIKLTASAVSGWADT